MGKVRIIEVQEAEEENVISFTDTVGTLQLSASAPMVWSGMEEKMAQVFMPRSLPTTLGKLPSPPPATSPPSPASNESTTTPPLADDLPSLSSAAASSPTPNVSPDSSLADDVPPSILHPSPAPSPSPSGLPSPSLSCPPPPSFPASILSLPACLPSLPPVLPSTSTPPRLPASLPPVPVPCKAHRTFSRLSLLDAPSSLPLPPSRLEATPSKLPPLDLSVLLKALGSMSTRVAPLPPIQVSVRAPEEREKVEHEMQSTEESDDETATVVVWSCDQEVTEENQELVEEELQQQKKKTSLKSRIIKFFRRLNCFHCGGDEDREVDF